MGTGTLWGYEHSGVTPDMTPPRRSAAACLWRDATYRSRPL